MAAAAVGEAAAVAAVESVAVVPPAAAQSEVVARPLAVGEWAIVAAAWERAAAAVYRSALVLALAGA